MSKWLSDPISAEVAHERASDPRLDRQLRRVDIALALAAVLVMALPILLASLVGTLQRRCMVGRAGHRFERLSLAMPDTLPGRVLSALGADGWPLLFNILRGEMSWVGPAPRAGALDAAHPCLRVRPGVTSLWDIRCRTALDFGTEDAATLEYLACRGVGHDLGLLARAAFVRVFAARRQAAAGRVRICDVEFDNVDMDEALSRLDAMLDGGEAHQVSFVNPACVNIAARHRGYRRSLARAGLVLPDGIGTKIAGDLLGTPLKQNVNGTDLFPRLCERLDKRGARLFLLGGQPGVAERVADVIRARWPGIHIVGVRDGFFTTAEEGDVAAQVRACQADILLVARGVPMQDAFIDRYLHHFGVRVAMGVGGLFDFVCGRINRAPRWMRDIGMEWAYRLIQEPARMWRRYLVGNVTFLARVALQRLRLRHPAADTRPLADGSVVAAGPTAAVLLATVSAGADLPGAAGHPAALMPLGALSFIERAIIQLVRAEVRDIHIVVCDRPDLMRRVLGDGSRWGVRLVWHLAKDEHQALRLLPRLAHGDWQRVIVARAEQWIGQDAVQRLAAGSTFAERLDPAAGTTWAGWASLHPRLLASLGASGSLEMMLRACIGPRMLLDRRAWASAGSARHLLDAQALMCGDLAVADAPRSWIPMPWGVMSPTARVSPAAQIAGPAIIGPGCLVEAGARLGRDVVLTRNVIVNGDTSIESSLVLGSTYVGSGLELRDAIVSGNAVQHVEMGVRTLIPESDGLLFALGRRERGASWLGRLMAVVALVLLAPVTALAALRTPGRRAPLWTREVVVAARANDAASGRGQRALRLPGGGLRGWQRVAAQFGPLLDVAAGRRTWMGVRPRSSSEWYALHPDWQQQLERAPVGVLHAPRWSDDPVMAIESAAAADLYWLAQNDRRARLRVAMASIRELATGAELPA